MDLHPLRDYPAADPLDVPAHVVDPHQFLGPLRHAAWQARRRQVGRQLGQIDVRAGGQRRLQALVKLGRRQPAVAGGDPQDLDDLFPVVVRGAQPWRASRVRVLRGRGRLTVHDHILLSQQPVRQSGHGAAACPQGPDAIDPRDPAAGSPSAS